MKKVKIKYLGNDFLLNEKVIKKTDYNGNPMKPKVEIGRVEGASMIKQYIKKKYPTLKNWSVSDSFANGNSIDVYVCNTDGSKVDELIYKDIARFADSLKMGVWNGMEDIYENFDRDKSTNDGMSFVSYCKYLHVQNQPKFGTIEWGVNRLNTAENETVDSILYYIDDNKKEKFIKLYK